jgi:hypothetical protein
LPEQLSTIVNVRKSKELEKGLNFTQNQLTQNILRRVINTLPHEAKMLIKPVKSIDKPFSDILITRKKGGFSIENTENKKEINMGTKQQFVRDMESFM